MQCNDFDRLLQTVVCYVTSCERSVEQSGVVVRGCHYHHKFIIIIIYIK